jgi:hypothetical protein
MGLFIGEVIALLGMGALFWLIALQFPKNTEAPDQLSNQRYFRVFFMLMGFFMFIEMFLTAPTFFISYTVPTNSTVPYYNPAQVSTLASNMGAIAYGVVVAMVLYFAIEMIIFFRNLLDIRKIKAAERSQGYGKGGF